MAEAIKVRNAPAQHIGVANSAPCPEMNIVAKEITENGRYEASTEGVTGFDPVIVNVPSREEIGYENGYAAGYGKGSTDGYADAVDVIPCRYTYEETETPIETTEEE